jgi:hypothetical protein
MSPALKFSRGQTHRKASKAPLSECADGGIAMVNRCGTLTPDAYYNGIAWAGSVNSLNQLYSSLVASQSVVDD